MSSLSTATCTVANAVPSTSLTAVTGTYLGPGRYAYAYNSSASVPILIRPSHLSLWDPASSSTARHALLNTQFLSTQCPVTLNMGTALPDVQNSHDKLISSSATMPFNSSFAPSAVFVKRFSMVFRHGILMFGLLVNPRIITLYCSSSTTSRLSYLATIKPRISRACTRAVVSSFLLIFATPPPSRTGDFATLRTRTGDFATAVTAVASCPLSSK